MRVEREKVGGRERAGRRDRQTERQRDRGNIFYYHVTDISAVVAAEL